MKSDTPAPRSATHNRARTGKIAQLPKENRDAINRMIQDGVPYQNIIDSLGELAHEQGLNCHHLIRWKQDGYQDWLKENGDAEKAEKESTLDDVKQNGGTDIQEAALRLATSQMHQIFKGFRMQPLNDIMESDPKIYAAIAKGLAKLSQTALHIEKFKEAVAEQRHQRQAELDEDKPRGLSRETLKQIEEALNLL